MLNLLCPPFQGFANATHLHESDKSIEVQRLSTKLEALYRTEALHGECSALTCKVNKLPKFISTEPTCLFREFTIYRMMVIKVIVACEGLKNNT